MGFWSDTFGGGNSFTESVANVFTPNDGKSYVGGELTTTTSDNQSGLEKAVGSISNTVSNITSGITGGGSSTYTIKAGDTLSDIAKANGTTVAAIMAANPSITDPNKIYVGNNLKIGATGRPNVVGYSDGNTASATDPATGAATTAEGTTPAEDAPEDNPLSPENILKMAETAGLVTSNEEIAAMIADPVQYLKDRGMTLADLIAQNGVLLDPNAAGTNLDASNPNYALGDSPAYTATTVNDVATADEPGMGPVTTYSADTVADRIAGNAAATADAATGTIRDENLVNADDIQIDMEGAATGVNADGSTNYTGAALNDYATQSTSMIIDTSTAAGKLLAEKLGEGNYTDSKATILGQMEIISAEFKDSNGNPVIPPWAQGLARSVSRTMAFTGVTGTAATAAMSNAIMEATLGIAEKEANFFQTLTVKNLDNRQQAIINKANVLAQFEVANLDARQAAAVQNAKAFLEMDLTNLTNLQQAEIVNTQAMVDALFNDQAAVNAARLFGAEQANDFQKFYDNLTATVQIHNTQMINSMAQFNAGEINDAAQFNAEMENGRQKFYAEMQYNIDKFNATWRQEVATTNSEMLYDAYAADVKNSFDLSQEGLNRMWDRVDSMLDYIFTATENEATRDMEILKAEIMAQANSGSGSSGIWGAVGSVGAALVTAW